MQDGKDFTGCQHIDSLYLIIAEHCVRLSTPSAAICKACGLTPSEQQLLKKLTLYTISINTLHTLLYTFPLILTRRICLTIKVS